MNVSLHLAKHFKEVHFGDNWTWSTLKDALEDVTFEQATTKIDSLNTIAALVYHINYYVCAVMSVLEGKPLTSKQKLSFDHKIETKEDWENMLSKTWSDAEKFVKLTEQLPDSKLDETFFDEKHGNYFRNIMGVIEHTHYHLGQIVLIKKLIQEKIEN